MYSTNLGPDGNPQYDGVVETVWEDEAEAKEKGKRDNPALNGRGRMCSDRRFQWGREDLLTNAMAFRQQRHKIIQDKTDHVLSGARGGRGG